MCTTINDPIYSSITIRGAARLILDTPEVQRLRELRQLGVVYYVYPSAVHSRFEHSLGCMHLAEEFLSAIEKNHQHLGVTIYLKEDKYFFGGEEGNGGEEKKEGEGERAPPDAPDAAVSSLKKKRIKEEIGEHEIPSSSSLKGEGGGRERREDKEHHQQMDRAGRITSQDYDCLAIAGLCHDLGHGPFSHLFEHVVNYDWKDERRTKTKQEEWSHEDMSLLLLNRIWKRLQNALLTEYGLTSQDHAFVQLLITGLPPNSPFPSHKVGRPAWKRFMVDIVANKVNGLDVDKLDYLQRDGFFTGHRESFQVRRLFQNAFVVPVPKSKDGVWGWRKASHQDTPSGQYRICYAEKMEMEVKQIFDCRLKMHKLVYLHRVVIQTQRMVRDILSLCGHVQCIRKEHSSSSSSDDDDDDEEEEGENEDETRNEGKNVKEEEVGVGRGGNVEVANTRAERRRRTATAATTLMRRGGEEKKRKRERERTKKRGGGGGRLYSLREAVWNPSIFSCTGDWVLKLFRHMDIYTVPLYRPSFLSSSEKTTTSRTRSASRVRRTVMVNLNKKETSDLPLTDFAYSCSHETVPLSGDHEEEDNEDKDAKRKKSTKNGGEDGTLASFPPSSRASVELLLPNSRRDAARTISPSPSLPCFLPPERHCLLAAQSLLKRLELRMPYNYLGVILCNTAEQVGYAMDSFLLPKIMEDLRAHHFAIYHRLREWERGHVGLPALCSERIQFSLATKECQTAVAVADEQRMPHPPSVSPLMDGRFVESGGVGGAPQDPVKKRKSRRSGTSGGRRGGRSSPAIVGGMKLHPKVIMTYVNSRDFVRLCKRETASLARPQRDTEGGSGCHVEEDHRGEVGGWGGKKRNHEEEAEEEEEEAAAHCHIMHNNVRPLEAEVAEDERFVYWVCRLPRPPSTSRFLPSPLPPPHEAYEGRGGETGMRRESTGAEGGLTVGEETIIMETIRKVFLVNHPREELTETDNEEEEPEVLRPDPADAVAIITDGDGGKNNFSQEIPSSFRFSSEGNFAEVSPSPSHPSNAIFSPLSDGLTSVASVNDDDYPSPSLLFHPPHPPHPDEDGRGKTRSRSVLFHKAEEDKGRERETKAPACVGGGSGEETLVLHSPSFSVEEGVEGGHPSKGSHCRGDGGLPHPTRQGSLRSRSLAGSFREGSSAPMRLSGVLTPEERISMKRQKSN